MTTFEVLWGEDNAVRVSTVAELNDIISDIEGQRGDGDAPFKVAINAVDNTINPSGTQGLDIGVGNPDRAFAFWAGDGGGWGREPGVRPITDELGFDYSGQWTQYYPDQTCVMPETAKAAAREFVTTGRRPTIVQWWDPDNEAVGGGV